MTTLEAVLREKIRNSGPVDIGTFMKMALTDPGHGYYMNRDPLGEGGDFTTAPEISQMFGELLGAWAADTWMKLGSPGKFRLLECGPGRGTLMADAMRATAKVPGFHQAATIVLLEASPALQRKQYQLLSSYVPQWIKTLADELPGEGPVILLANEFLDALPVRQLVFTNGQWRERTVTLDVHDSLSFGNLPFTITMPVPVAGQEGDIYEFSPERDEFIRATSRILKEQGGAALFIDYGHTQSSAGDTLQAIRKHQFVPVFQDIGDADLTAHVDFAAVKYIAEQESLIVSGPAEQGTFLHNLGIALRAEALMRITDRKEDILHALHRLTAADQMGKLFKVIALCHDETGLSGF
jgi:NADH dehydrogenase [ubiquinone] 1 alpha subcomplex assembly factor 7